MTSAFKQSILACAAILAMVGTTTQVSAQQQGLKHYESGNKDFWQHPPNDWFLGGFLAASAG